MTICRMLLLETDLLAAIRTRLTATIRMPARIAMMTMTVSNSIRVNAESFLLEGGDVFTVLGVVHGVVSG